MPTAGIVLAGSRSSRMGAAKADLPWGDASLVEHVAQVVRAGVGDGPDVVVRAAGQVLPTLPGWAEVAVDAAPGRGPLEGILAGLCAIDQRAAIAFVAACDLPLLVPAFVAAVVAALDDDHDVALPVAFGHRQPLAAAYRVSLASRIAALAPDERVPPALFDLVRVRELGPDALLADPHLAVADPDLRSLTNVNDPAAYAALRQRAAPR